MIEKSNTANIRNLLTPMLSLPDMISYGEPLDADMIQMLAKQVHENVNRIIVELAEIDKSKKIIEVQDSYYCTECKSLCHPYEQGLACGCDQPWITEVIDESKYPSKWIRCKVEIKPYE